MGLSFTITLIYLLLGIIDLWSFSFYTFQSSAPVELTEAETEYAVNVVKHIFDNHVVFQYNCTNTIPEQLLENVSTILPYCIGDNRTWTAISYCISLFAIRSL